MTHFFHSESGAVTVDWVVLTAALVGVGLATMAVISGGVEDLANDTDSQLKSNHIISSSFNVLPGIVSAGSSTLPTIDASCSSRAGAGTCTHVPITGIETFNMDDGSQWQRHTTLNNGITYTSASDGNGNTTYGDTYGQPDLVEWFDGNGDLTDAPHGA